MRHNLFRSLLTAFVLLQYLPVAAQTTTGRIAGSVTDPTGALVPGAQLEAVEINSSRRWETATDEAGTYSLAALPLGTYRLTARRAGFKTSAADEIILTVDEVVRLDIR